MYCFYCLRMHFAFLVFFPLLLYTSFSLNILLNYNIIIFCRCVYFPLNFYVKIVFHVFVYSSIIVPISLYSWVKSNYAAPLDQVTNLFAAHIYFFYYHIAFRDNVLPAILCYILYSEAFPRSQPPPARIFLAIFLQQDRRLWVSEVGTTLKKDCSLSCFLFLSLSPYLFFFHSRSHIYG